MSVQLGYWSSETSKTVTYLKDKFNETNQKLQKRDRI
jgi:hypothetical protein